MNILITGNIASGKSRISDELVARQIVEPWRYYSIDELRRRFSDGTFSGEYYAWSLFFRAAQSETGGLFEFSGVGRNAPVIRDIVRDSVENAGQWRIISCNVHVDTIARRLSDKSTDLPLPYRIGKSKRALFESALHANQHILERLETGYWHCPELVVETDRQSLDESVDVIIEWLNVPISIGAYLPLGGSSTVVASDQRLLKQREKLQLFCDALDKAGRAEVSEAEPSPYIGLRDISNSLAGSDLEKELRSSFFQRIGYYDYPKDAYKFIEVIGLRAVFFRYLRSFDSESWISDYEISVSILENIESLNLADGANRHLLILFALFYPGFLIEDKYPVKIPRQIRDIQECLIGVDLSAFLAQDDLDGIANCIVGVKLLKSWSATVRRRYSNLNYVDIGRGSNIIIGDNIGFADFKVQLSKLSSYHSGLLALAAKVAGYPDVFTSISGL
jgi:hypothetical protein